MGEDVVLPWQYRVCVKCLRQNPHAIWLVKYGCHHSEGHTNGREVLVVIDHKNMELVEVRPPPDTIHQFHGRFYMCRHVNNCWKGGGCLYAHSELEMDNWNTMKTISRNPDLLEELRATIVISQSPSAVCKECFTLNPNAVWLSWLTCTNKTHSDTGRVTVVTSRDRKSLVKVRNPKSVMTNLKPAQLIVCQHINKCKDGEGCKFAHSEEELAYWKWKVATKRIKRKLSTTMLGDSSFTELWEKYSYPGENTDVLLSGVRGPLSCDTYKEKYHKLVFLDNLEHVRKMVADCDGEVTIDKSARYGNLYHNEVHIVGMHNGSTAMDFAIQVIPPCKVEISVGGKLFSGSVARKTDTTLVVGLDKPGSLSKLPVTGSIHFEYSNWYFWRLHRAISHAHPSLIRRLVEPHQSYHLPILSRGALNQKLGDFKLDLEYQTKALEKMLLCRPGSPFLLLGPFGTGKTHLIAAAVIKLVKAGGSNILICTHQNKGAAFSVSNRLQFYPSIVS